MKKRYLASLSILIAFSSLLFCSSRLVRFSVENRNPGILVGDVELGWGQYILRDISIDRGRIKGTVKQATVNWEGDVVVTGGDLEVDLDAKSPATLASKPGSRSLSAHGLYVKAKKGDVRAEVQKLSVEGNRVCFEEGTVTHAKYGTARASGVCSDREVTWLSASRVTLMAVPLPVFGPTDVVVSIVRVDPEFKQVQAVSVDFDARYRDESVSVKIVNAEASFTGLVAEQVQIASRLLSSERSIFANVKVTPEAEAYRIRFGTGAELKINPSKIEVSGNELCAVWSASLPEGMKPPPLDKLGWVGRLEFTVGLQPPSVKIKGACVVFCDKTFPNLRKPFTYRAYTYKGTRFDRQSGPGSKEWVPLSSMGQVLPLAVVNLEDPGYQSHFGFINQAYENSLIINVKEGRAVRGGSTLTMQLAKNLWLDRDKTLGRKIDELFLAQALESCLNKEQILETYLNVVEFGPDVYGAGAGARKWFKAPVEALSPAEAFWLATILPAPKKAVAPNEASLKRIEATMRKMAASGKMPDFVGVEGDGELPEQAPGWE